MAASTALNEPSVLLVVVPKHSAPQALHKFKECQPIGLRMIRSGFDGLSGLAKGGGYEDAFIDCQWRLTLWGKIFYGSLLGNPLQVIRDGNRFLVTEILRGRFSTEAR